MRATRAVAVVLALVTPLVLPASKSAAAPCETASGESVSEDEARARTRALHEALERNRRHMRAWNITWGSLYSAATAAQTTAAIALDGDDRRVYGVGGARAAIAAAAVPLLGVRTRALVLTGDVCADLVLAESVLEENVRLHAKGRGWFKHAGVVGLNLAAFLTLGLGFDLWERGAIGGAIGVAVGEIQIFTQPMGSRDILRRYQARGRVGPTSPAAQLYLAPMVSADGFGLMIGGAL